VSLPLPALDAHAHVRTNVPAGDLAGLRAGVFAMTREPAEWDAALERSDSLSVWGIGAHPALARGIEAFDGDRFARELNRAHIVGEVGLDGKARVPKEAQQRVLDMVLEAVAATPRPVSLHSVAASGEVLAALRRRPVAAPILHWWRGSAAETEEAVELGCFFSFNGAEARSPKVLDLVPPERILTETDFPHSRRSDRAADRPAAVQTIEAALGERWSLDTLGVRRRVWRNLGDLFESCGTAERMPPGFIDALLTAG